LYFIRLKIANNLANVSILRDIKKEKSKNEK